MESSIALPDDLVNEVLRCLPLKSLMRFACLSKTWLTRISDPGFHRHKVYPSCLLLSPHPFTFIPLPISNSNSSPSKVSFLDFLDAPDMELNVPISNSNSSPSKVSFLDFLDVPDMELNVMQSCNGLLLVKGTKKHTLGFFENVGLESFYHEIFYFVCNPIVKRFQKLPVPTDLYSLFLVFDPMRSSHFSVISVRRELESTDYKLFSYSSETQQWNDLGIICLNGGEEEDSSLRLHTYSGVYLNGCIFWPDYCAEKGLYFDVEKQSLQAFPMPPDIDKLDCVYFGESGGHLHMIMQEDNPSSCYLIDIVELQQDYSSWFVRFHLDLTLMAQDFAITSPYFLQNSRDALCLVRREKEEDSILVLRAGDKILCYNLVNGNFQALLTSKGDCIENVYQYNGNLFWVP